MRLVPTEEQRLIADTARELFRTRAPVARSRALRHAGSATHDSDATRSSFATPRELWTTFAELGWTGVHLPEELGGVGLGYRELCALLEHAGRVLAPEPLVPCLVMAAEPLRRLGSPAQQARWLAPIADGSTIATLADREHGARYRRTRCATRATRDGDGWRLDGTKVHVAGGMAADQLLVTARVDGAPDDRHGMLVFVVDPASDGVRRTLERRIDGHDAATITFDGVVVAADAALGDASTTADALDAVYDRIAIASSAELLGVVREAFDMTLAYLKERVQFGVPIGSFQALQHRIARRFISLELARSSVIGAAAAVDETPDEVPALAALASAQCIDAALDMTNEAVQMHGGIGMTDEHDIGLYLKRARALAQSYGDAAYWRDRWATLHGY